VEKNKCKLVKKAGVYYWVIKGKKGQQLSEREIYAINQGEVPGLLHLEILEKKSGFLLRYPITGLLSLQEYLKVPLAQKDFICLLSHILENLKMMQKAYFNIQNMILDTEHVMVNPVTQQIGFLYIPISFLEKEEGNLKNFLLDLVSCCSFVAEEDTACVREYIMILNTGLHFSVFELEEYVKKWMNGKEG